MIRVKPILPKGIIFDAKQQKAAIAKGMDVTTKRVTEAYDQIVGSWKNKPSITVDATDYERNVNVDGEIYSYVDDGTKPHTITPKRGKMLVFGAGGTPKTQPGVIGSGGGSRGSTRVFAKVVHHPGTKKRDFEKAILKQVVEPNFATDVQQAINETSDD